MVFFGLTVRLPVRAVILSTRSRRVHSLISSMSDFSSFQFSASLRTSASIETGTYRQRVFPSALSVSVYLDAFPTVCLLRLPAMTPSRSSSVRSRETVAL